MEGKKIGEKIAERKETGWQEREEQVARKILQLSRTKLYFSMRFLDMAFSALLPQADWQEQGVGTDGTVLYFHPAFLCTLYRKEPIQVNRLYLHTVLHCLFYHLTRRKGREERLYFLACDIAVESIIDSLNHPPLRRGRAWLRRQTYHRLEDAGKVLTAERTYEKLKQWELSEEEMFRLEEEFRRDSHSFWPKEEDEKSREMENRWRQLSEQTQTDVETFAKESADSSKPVVKQLQIENRKRYDYREFLRKFAVLKEEVQMDEDSFDYGFYTYGLSLYGNMPLIEPQEWKEVEKIEEFVIVVDTSMSCSGETVRRFLEETYDILAQKESYFRNIHIRILQCDDQVRSDDRITSAEELKTYMEGFRLVGEGGTDFRPAFAYVEKLVAEKQFHKLRGLIYFTDGKGIYPARKPPYQTAFVFMKQDYQEESVPPWAIRLILEEEEWNG